ncbi:MAG TPA: hypothetical protein PL070_13925 [Flavobacteriales bacterium]|nr:hypothetical protein [Flavobacteriales bacterium]
MSSISVERRLNLLSFIICIMAIFMVALLFLVLRSGAGTPYTHFTELTVGQLNIAGPDSVKRIIMSHKMPMAPFQGEQLERTVPPGLAGMIFCAPNGDEVGGIGVSGTTKGGAALIALDYRNVPLEAIGFSTYYDENGQSAGFVIMDPPRGTVDVKKLNADDQEEVERFQAMMVQRVDLSVSNEKAGLTISDRQGNVRILIGLDEDDEPSIQLRDKEGHVTKVMASDHKPKSKS